MGKSRLYVFAGKPGAGKTTIIKNLFSKKRIIHVSDFLNVFRVDKEVPTSRCALAYQNLYLHLSDLKDEEVALEIGTNYPKFNVKKLVRLQKKYKVIIFLCVAPDEILYQRAEARGNRHSTEAFLKRMRRNFPNTFLEPLKQTKLNYVIVDTGGSVETTLEKFKKILQENKNF